MQRAFVDGPSEPEHRSAKLCLAVMGITALDTDAVPLYFAGWRPIARALNLSGSDAVQRNSVSRLWRTLRQLGYIERKEDEPGRKAVWILWPGRIKHERE